jgi:putative zinc finger/helix-turn-helix YgiT family protein
MAKCVSCGRGTMKVGKAIGKIRVGSHEFSAEVPVRRCSSCKETYWNGPAMERLEIKAAAELARVGEVNAAAFRLQRKALGLLAKELAQLLDLTAEQISKYENGKAAIDRRAAALLATMLLEKDAGRRDTRDRLESLRKPHKLAAQVRLRVA